MSLSNGIINAGEFFSLTSFVFAAIEPIEAVGRFSSLISQMSGAIHQIHKILDDAASDTANDDGQDDSNSSQHVSLDVDLVLDNVWFSYTPQGPKVLKGVSAKIPAGSYVAGMNYILHRLFALLCLVQQIRPCLQIHQL
jgi:ABC-type multidrug transport system fused ATPase/permease subunit